MKKRTAKKSNSPSPVSTAALALGLVISLILHAWFMLGSSKATAKQAPQMQTVDVVAIEQFEQPIEQQPELQPEKIEQSGATDSEVVRENESPQKSEPQPSPQQPEPQSVPEKQPTPQLEQSQVAHKTLDKQKGSFAGSTKGRVAPALHIDWNGYRHAISTLAAGQMKLVVIDARDASIYRQVISRANRWTVEPYQSPLAIKYSNRLRIVHDVAAFSPVRRELNLRPNEQLAVMITDQWERKLQSAQLAAAFDRGLDMNDIAQFGGRFNVTGKSLAFEITHVMARRTN